MMRSSTTISILLHLSSSFTNGLLIPSCSKYTSQSSCIRWSTLNAANNSWAIDDDDEYLTKEIDPSPSSSLQNTENNQQQDVELNNQNDKDTRSYFATCIPGLHHTLSSELHSIGATQIECRGNSGVSFTGSAEIGLLSLLWCRTAHKIMELIASSTDDHQYHDNDGIRNSQDLYDFTKSSIHTPSLLGNGSGGLLTLSVSTIYTKGRDPVPKELCHTHYTALTVKNALVDSVRELREDGDRPDVDTDDADVPLVVVLRGRRAGRSRYGRNEWRREYGQQKDDREELVADVDIYRCLHSGGSLHKRGYRSGDASAKEEEDDSNYSNTPIHRAAMKESLAAGLLLECGWDKLIAAAKSDGLGAILVDPMTGSATLPTEAALIACDMAPGLSRIAAHHGKNKNNPHLNPPAVRWKDFSTQNDWNRLLNEAAARARAGVSWAKNNNVSIYCNEMNPRAVSLAKSSIKNSGVGSIISLHEGNCVDWTLNDKVIPGRTIFVCNPPWGVRLTEDIDESWVSLREFLRREASGSEAWVLSGNKDLTKILRMKTSRKVVVKTGEEDLRWLQYHIFQKEDVEQTAA